MSEDVVLVDDESWERIGTMPKSEVHTASTPLHLAFSTYVFAPDGDVLVTRRAWHKPTWPGVVTNSCCGHPTPTESLAEAVRRRVGEELGVEATAIDLVLPGFSYFARMSDGTVENEVCPVFRVQAPNRDLGLDPEEVDEARWTDWSRFASEVRAGTREVSPWCRDQIVALTALGREPGRWQVASDSLLPPAALTDVDTPEERRA